VTATFPKREVEDAFAEYRRRGVGSLDWVGFTDLFTPDARYVEHNLGVFEGRTAIREWLIGAMAQLPALTFDIDWWVIDGNRVAFNIWNLLPDPTGGGRTFAFSNATVIEYAGDGLWSFEEDYYNPANANQVVGEWLKAGGSPAVAPDQSLRGPVGVLPSAVAHTRDEVEREFGLYVARGGAGDWSAWADQFSENARYYEHHYGRFEGREAIRAWITEAMKPFPMMEFPVEWHMIDGNRVVMLCQNRLPDPVGRDRDFEFPTMVVLHYDGDGQWGYEEDIYNPDEAPPVVTAWLAAGGVLA
jgi:predicted SnoaL-like aldol condensation-catalyzing enzyme